MYNIDQYQIFLIIIILFITIPSIILQYKTLQRYKDSKYIDVILPGSQKNIPCTYDTKTLSNPKCYNYKQAGSTTSIEYVIYKPEDSNLTYGLSKSVKTNICNTLCSPTDYYTLVVSGSKYSILSNLEVISQDDPTSKGMTVNVSINTTDGSISEIKSFNSSGKNYNLNDTLQIIHKDQGSFSEDEICTFRLTSFPKGGCIRNNDYNKCIIDTVQNPKCSNSKPLAIINDNKYYPNIVWKNSVNSLKTCTNI